MVELQEIWLSYRYKHTHSNHYSVVICDTSYVSYHTVTGLYVVMCVAADAYVCVVMYSVCYYCPFHTFILSYYYTARVILKSLKLSKNMQIEGNVQKALATNSAVL